MLTSNMLQHVLIYPLLGLPRPVGNLPVIDGAQESSKPPRPVGLANEQFKLGILGREGRFPRARTSRTLLVSEVLGSEMRTPTLHPPANVPNELLQLVYALGQLTNLSPFLRPVSPATLLRPELIPALDLSRVEDAL